MLQVDPTELAQHAEGLKDPIRYVAAVLMALWLSTLGVLMRVLQTRVDQEEAHKAEIKKLLEDERMRSLEQAKREFAIEHVAAGLLKLVEIGALVVRAGRPPKDPMAADAPTLSLKLGGGDDGRGKS